MPIEVIAKNKAGATHEHPVQILAGQIMPLILSDKYSPEHGIAALGLCLSGMVQVMSHAYPKLSKKEHEEIALKILHSAMGATTLEVKLAN